VSSQRNAEKKIVPIQRKWLEDQRDDTEDPSQESTTKEEAEAMSQINWVEDFDPDDNSYWEGASPYVDETFYWRLCQNLQDNKIVWVDCSDNELVGDGGETWSTIEEAKAACQKAHDNILTEEL